MAEGVHGNSMSLIKIFQNKINTFTFLFNFKKADYSFYNFSIEKWKRNTQNKNKGEIIVDVLFDDLHIFQLSYITNFFYLNADLIPKYFHIIHREKILLRLIFKFFRKFTRINKLYSSFGCSFAFGQKKYKKSIIISKSLKFNSKKELLAYQIENVIIGDLIYDAYLRMNTTATVDLSDKKLNEIIINALDVYFSCKEYLDTHNVKKVVLSHAVYINYGILARVSLERGIDVYNPLWERVFHKLSLDHTLPTLKHSEYPKIFNNMSSQEKIQKRAAAKKILESRLRGEVDRGIFYMPFSPYHVNNKQENFFLDNGKPKVVLMLHCFYDSPHVYKDMIFEDFYEWFDFVLSKVGLMDVDFLVKPHPNAKPYNEDIINNFKSKYPTIRFVDKTTSNAQLISEGLTAILSVYGSVAHEFAYLGVPVLLAGDNPTAPYNFCYMAKNQAEYEYYLLNIEKLKERVNFSKSQVEEFFYMHYLHNHMGRINGNNDIFYALQRNWRNQNNDIFNDLVQDAKDGKFDNVFNDYKEAFAQLDLA